ncbi:hypothetical protein ASPWEDRAFT_46610 [Aspergillus wentii DTO 134E9]|uniref:Uncharacterized protein n=1 Tax=Aspergillus wentii DTO 134E9 TaxID=1073089 RepID=A0A1L9R4L9_ASPWE|nr:uncharacterized protein ASPWEDRAFT_46610 [Aspergillus wentii DTO 134E9]OJJ29844.1 hypothetical protein ASPWEDRAFT_46610 [Aspergillus wentii DTO 134E9]
MASLVLAGQSFSPQIPCFIPLFRPNAKNNPVPTVLASLIEILPLLSLNLFIIIAKSYSK